MRAPTHYRKPTVPVPPHENCDRWCERCPLQRTRCEMFARLYPQGVAARMPRIRWGWHQTLRRARQLVRQQPRLLEVAERVSQPPPADPTLAAARPYVYGVLDLTDHRCSLLRQLGGRHLSVAGLGRCAINLWSKLCRASGCVEPGSMDAILSAQVAHQSLVESIDGLCRLLERRHQPARVGGLILLGLDIARTLEQRWLRLPHPELVPARDELDRWGPIQRPWKHRAVGR